MPTPADDLWSSICAAATPHQRQRSTPTTPRPSPTEERAQERALIEALCGGMVQWQNDAQIFLVHHWRCTCCGSSGTFPNLDPRGRLIRRHNRAGTTWICHDPSDDQRGGEIAKLPKEFQHHHHNVGWCPSCVQETTPFQSNLHFPTLRPCHISPGVATRVRPYV
jgi:hypothetical protein